MARYDPKPMWQPAAIPSLKILAQEADAFAAPAATAPSYIAAGAYRLQVMISIYVQTDGMSVAL